MDARHDRRRRCTSTCNPPPSVALSDAGLHSDEPRAHATVPASLVDEAGTLVVHRMHREALVARGLEGGEVRFDFSRSVAYVRR